MKSLDISYSERLRLEEMLDIRTPKYESTPDVGVGLDGNGQSVGCPSEETPQIR